MTEQYYVYSGKHGFEVRHRKEDGKVYTISSWLYEAQAKKAADELNQRLLQRKNHPTKQ